MKVKLNKAELQVLQTNNGIRLAQMNLCQIMGLPLDTPICVHTIKGMPSTGESLLMADITQRPEYLILSDQAELSEQQTHLTRGEHLPTVGIIGGYNYIDSVRLNSDKLMSKRSFSAALSVKIPLFEWGKGSNKVKMAKLDENMAALQLLQAEEKMMLEVAQAMNAFEEAQAESRLTARSMQQAEENMRLSKDLYEVGMETLSDYLEAQTLWQKACSDHVNARTNEELSRTLYLKAAGKL